MLPLLGAGLLLAPGCAHGATDPLVAPTGVRLAAVTPPVGNHPAPPTTTTSQLTPVISKTPVFGSEDELILELRTPHGEMTDTITGHGLRQGVYLPFGAIAHFLDLAINVGDGGNFASGWFLSQKRTLIIDLRAHKATVAGHDIILGQNDAVAFQGELYLRAERFADLLPIKLAIDLRTQTVTVTTREPFPYEERLSREAMRARLGAASANTEKHYPRDPTPWSALSYPMGDVETRAISASGFGTHVENDLRLAGDVAFMTGRLYLSTSSLYGITAARVELGRRDPDGAMLGPLHASEFQLGDVASASLPAGFNGITGRGAFVTSAPLSRVSVFDTVELRGELPDGYEVELYRNNSLIGSTKTPVNGQYLFTQVPVDFGINVFRLVFYGPQGQRREEVRQINVGDGRLSPGQFAYTVGAAQNNIGVFNIKGPNWASSLDYGAWRSVAIMQYGVSTALTVQGGGAWFQAAGVNYAQAYSGLRTGFANVAIKADLNAQNGGGIAADVGLGGRLMGLSYVITHAEYRGGYLDETRALSDLPLSRASDLTLNTTLHLGGSGSTGGLYVPITGHFDEVDYAGGQGSQTDAMLRSTMTVAHHLVSNELDYQATSNLSLLSNEIANQTVTNPSTTPANAISVPGTAPTSAPPPTLATKSLVGAFDLSSISSGPTQYRTTVAYSVLPNLSLAAAGVEVDERIDDRSIFKAAVTHTIADNDTSLGLSAQRRFNHFALSLDSSYGVAQNSYSVLMRLGFSFGRNPLSGRWFAGQPGLSSGGAVVMRTFRDVNENGSFDAGDTPLAGVAVNVGGQHAVTDAHGVALVGGLGDGSRTNITIDPSTLPDVDLAPTSPGRQVVTRAGHIHVIQVPVVMLGDIEGTAYIAESNAKILASGADGREVSGLVLLLCDAAGKQISRVRSGSDGYFLFEQLRAGNYTLRLDPSQASSLKIHLDHPINVHLDPKASPPRIAVTVRHDA